MTCHTGALSAGRKPHGSTRGTALSITRFITSTGHGAPAIIRYADSQIKIPEFREARSAMNIGRHAIESMSPLRLHASSVACASMSSSEGQSRPAG